MPSQQHTGDIFGVVNGTPVSKTHQATAVTAYQLVAEGHYALKNSISDPEVIYRHGNVGDWIVDWSDGRRQLYTNTDFGNLFS